MNKLNGFTIQQKLKQMKKINHPMLQAELGLSYGEAKELLGELLSREWIEKAEEGGYYKIKEDNLRLRKIERSEVDILFRDIDYESISIMRKLSEKGCLTENALYPSPLRRVKGKTVLSRLCGMRLIYEGKSGYFLCISAKALEVMAEVLSDKDILFEDSEGEVDEELLEKIKSKYDELFED